MNGIPVALLLAACLAVWSGARAGDAPPAGARDGSESGFELSFQFTFKFNNEQKKSRYIKTFERWAEEDRGKLPARDGVLCVGSSSMRGWRDIREDLKPLEVIHRGFGGSTMRDVLLFKEFLVRYEAGTILVYEGDNDLMADGTTPAVFLDQCRAFCDAVFERRPDTKVFFISVKPSPRRWHRWPRFMEANRMLAAFCDSDARLGFIDVATPMLGEDGKPLADIFLKDRLHMNRKGYNIWRDAVRSAVIEGEHVGDGFLLGGDISMLTRIEELGGVFREDGRPGDPIRIMMDHGCNCFRLRLFVDPNGRNQVVNDLPYTLALAKRIKSEGARLLLDLHYSDTWADPGHQTKPAAWRDLDFEALERQVEDYTASVIAEFRKAGALPDIVQVGNEITPGFLWPEGKSWSKEDQEGQQEGFTRLLRAGIRGVEAPLAEGERVKIMVHIDCGGNRGKTKWFFDILVRHDVRFDMIGLSYYPWWHGTLDDLRGNLSATAEAYGKYIVVVETAYPHRDTPWWRERKKKMKSMTWPMSPEGQERFMRDLIETVRETPRGLGRGVVYWYPESIPVQGIKVWNGGTTALFDEDGNALPAMRAFKIEARPSR